MDFNTAYRYATAWAHEEGVSIERLTIKEGHQFFGQLGSLALEYSQSSHVLLIRGTASVDGETYLKHPQFLVALKRVEHTDPKLKGFQFELYQGPWQKIHTDTLYLTLRVEQPFGSEKDFISEVHRLRDQSYYWHRVGLMKLILSAGDEKEKK
jgi:hypothetical protein